MLHVVNAEKTMESVTSWRNMRTSYISLTYFNHNGFEYVTLLINGHILMSTAGLNVKCDLCDNIH